MIYDIIIIGSGPGGLSASIYASRAGSKSLVIEKLFSGGQIINTYEVDNYLGIPEINGAELAMKMEAHAKSHDLNLVNDEVIDIIGDKAPFTVKCLNNEFQSKTIVIGTGAKPKLLELPKEKELTGKGVSYCATCDGAFFRNKTVAVLGSGNTAVEDAIFLSNLSEKVYLISRSDYLKADQTLLDSIKNQKNVEILYNMSAKELIGKEKLEQIIFTEKETNIEKIIDVQGVFVAIGVIPNSFFLENKLEKNKDGYIITNEKMETNIKGIYAIGDGRNTPLRQVITAVSDGAVAGYYATLESKSIN